MQTPPADWETFISSLLTSCATLTADETVLIGQIACQLTNSINRRSSVGIVNTFIRYFYKSFSAVAAAVAAAATFAIYCCWWCYAVELPANEYIAAFVGMPLTFCRFRTHTHVYLDKVNDFPHWHMHTPTQMHTYTHAHTANEARNESIL